MTQFSEVSSVYTDLKKNKKKILFIGTSFFNIEKHIINTFKELEYDVDYYDDRPSRSALLKGLIKVKPSIVEPLKQKYFEKIISETKDTDYNIVFILNGKILTEAMIKKLKSVHQNSEFVYYTYDSLRLYPHVINTLHLYDRAYTFDKKDSENNAELELLPLFYNRNVKSAAKKDTKLERYDILSVCTAHPNRYTIIKKLFPLLIENGVEIYSYLYLNKLQFLYNKFNVMEFKNSKFKEFKFKPLTEEENLAVLKVSKCVFDVEHSLQTGLTLRTIETLGAKKKLITTNKAIRDYNFYNENNIFILDDANTININEVLQFLKTSTEEIPNEIYEQYSIENWTKVITGIEKIRGYL